MRQDLISLLSNGKRFVFDGAMGTMLQAAGLSSGDCPELWNVENPAPVMEVMRAYIAAGSDIVSTNSFGGSRVKLGKYGLEDRVSELNRAAAAIGRQAAGEGRYVAASMGPTGELMEPYGDLTREQVVEAFAEQAAALAEGGADVLLLETFSDLNELLAGLEGARRAGLPVFCTLAFDTGGRTMMGTTPEAAAKALEEAGADAIGANCGGGPEQLLPVAEQLRAATSLPILIQPNAGLPELVAGRPVYPASPAFMAEYAHKLMAAGVQMLGGCCGTTPEHLAAIAQVVKA